MEDKKYDSDLIGWVDEPRYNDRGELMSWSLKLKDNELKDLLDNYVTKRDPETGHGGNVYIRLFVSKGGKHCASVFNPNSEGAKDYRAKATKTEDSGLPF